MRRPLPEDPSQFLPEETSYWLAHLCEANYRKLLRLLPNLHQVDHGMLANRQGGPALYCTLLDQAPHTLTLRLTHHFEEEGFLEKLPDMRIRLYLDAEAAEVLDDCGRPGVFATFAHQGKPGEIMAYKWRMNYFLHRWLDYCLHHDYSLSVDHGVTTP